MLLFKSAGYCAYPNHRTNVRAMEDCVKIKFMMRPFLATVLVWGKVRIEPQQYATDIWSQSCTNRVHSASPALWTLDKSAISARPSDWPKLTHVPIFIYRLDWSILSTSYTCVPNNT